MYPTIEIRYLFAEIHHSAQFIIWVFSVCMMFCKKSVVLHGHFVICICPCLVWIDAARIRHYLNAINALNARNPWSAVGNPTSALGPSGSSFGPSGLAPIGINHLLLSNLTTKFSSVRVMWPILESSSSSSFCQQSQVLMICVSNGALSCMSKTRVENIIWLFIKTHYRLMQLFTRRLSLCSASCLSAYVSPYLFTRASRTYTCDSFIIFTIASRLTLT